MKKIILLLICCLHIYAQAQQNVHLEEAERAATSFLLRMSGGQKNSISFDTFFVRENALQDTILYEFITSDSFFVLLSGSKACTPILGYGPIEDTYALWTDTSSVPQGLRCLLDDYSSQINYCFFNDTITLKHSMDWDDLQKYEEASLSTKSSGVGPLVTTSWGQTYSNDNLNADPNAYNYYVESQQPNGNNCCAGCVAVAMGQIMNYWKYPLVITNSTRQFDWGNMVQALSVHSPNYTSERNAIAWLLSECGEKVGMNYCSGNNGSSSANTTDIPQVLIGYGYSGNVDRILRLWNADNWVSILKEELDEGRPIIYGAYRYNSLFDYPGHSFICNGYDDNNMFCFNWGWWGQYNDSYFTLGQLCLSDGYDYEYFHEAIIGIQPSVIPYADYCELELPLGLFYSFYYNVNGITSPKPYYNVPNNYMNLVSVEEADNVPNDWMQIPDGCHSTYGAHKSITLKPGFWAKRGSDFTAIISPCFACEEDGAKSNNHYYHEMTDDSYVNYTIAADTTYSTRNNSITIYPNPASNQVYLQAMNISTAFIYDILGNNVSCKTTCSKTSDGICLNISNLPNGIYLIRIVDDQGNIATQKLIKSNHIK